MARDNFSKKIIGILKDRVANRCSKPDCRIPTTAPKEENKVTIIGVAAHICAASQGGPRYDKSMSSEERKSINNAIWLCNNCATLIDKNEKIYSINVLKEWKTLAENKAYEELGKKIPGNDTIDILSTALSGYPKKFLANAIENIHSATSQSLEQLDSRITVKTVFDEGNLSFHLSAKEEIPIEIKVNDLFSNEYAEKSRELFEHGKELKINSEAVEITGSPVIEKLFNNQNGIFSISPQKTSSTQRLTLVEKDTGLVEQFYDVFGHLTRGSKSATFTGVGCDGIFGISSTLQLEKNNIRCNSKISINYDLWDGKLINNLSFFEKIFSFINKIANGWYINISLEIEGRVLYEGHCNPFKELEKNLDALLVFLNYTNRCIKIANKFDLKILFNSRVTFTALEHKKIAEIVNIIERKCNYDKSAISGKIRIPFRANDDTNRVLNCGETKIKIVSGEKDAVVMFDKFFELGKRVIILNSVIARADKKIIKPGCLYGIELIPQENFTLSVFYESDFDSDSL